MARAALEWSLADLSAASGISRRTILRFERGETVMPATVKALRHALEAKGILFIDSGRLAGGVIPAVDHHSITNEASRLSGRKSDQEI